MEKSVLIIGAALLQLSAALVFNVQYQTTAGKVGSFSADHSNGKYYATQPYKVPELEYLWVYTPEKTRRIFVGGGAFVDAKLRCCRL